MFDDEDKQWGVYDGVVIDNADPLKIGRVQLMVPGLIEPASAWVLPICQLGAGSDAYGFWAVPPVGANVSVMFSGGVVDEPRYLPGPWGAPDNKAESPTFVRDLSPTDAPQITGIQTKRWEIIIDDREGQHELVIRDRTLASNVIRVDGQSQIVEVAGKVGVQIRSTGFVNISALQVTINGRLVLPNGKPI